MGQRHRDRRTPSGSPDRPAALTCEQVTSLISDYVTDAIDSATARAFESHLQGCRDCIAFLNTYQTTIQSTRSLRYEEAPAEMVSRVEEFLKQRLQPPPRTLNAREVWGRGRRGGHRRRGWPRTLRR